MACPTLGVFKIDLEFVLLPSIKHLTGTELILVGKQFTDGELYTMACPNSRRFQNRLGILYPYLA